MIDEGLFPIAHTRYIMLENPADHVQMPPPPAAESEAAVMWRPADIRNGDVERIPLSGEGDRDAAAVYGAWLGASLIHTMIADAKKDRRDDVGRPIREEDDDKPRSPKT